MGKQKNGATNGAGRFAGAIEASAAKEAAEKKKKPRGQQLKMKVDSRDAVHVKARHELHRPMTHAEWEEQSALLAKNRVALMTIEEEIAALKRKHAPEMKRLREGIDNGARQCDVREWLTMVDCIEVHDVNTRTVTVFADVSGEPGAQVQPSRPMRDDEYDRALKSSPFDPPEVHEPPPDDAETAEAEA